MHSVGGPDDHCAPWRSQESPHIPEASLRHADRSAGYLGERGHFNNDGTLCVVVPWCTGLSGR